MADFRSRSSRDMASYAENRAGTLNLQDMVQSYSGNYVNSSQRNQAFQDIKIEIKKDNRSSGLSLESWSFNERKLQRKRRVAGYKVYAVESKMKGSIRKSFRRIKQFMGIS